MNIKKRSLFNCNWLLLILIIPIFQPDFFKSILLIDRLFLFGKVLVLIIVILKYFNTRTSSKFGIMIIIFWSIMYYSTIMNGQPIFYAIKKTIENILICLIIELGVFYKRGKFIEIFYKYLYILVVVNFILLLVKPNGLIAIYESSQNYKAYFLSIKNGMIPWITLTSVLGLVNYHLNPSKKNKIEFSILLLIVITTMIFCKSSTGLIGTLIIGVYVICLQRTKLRRLINVKNVSLVGIALFFSIVILKVNLLFSNAFFILFKKNATFTGRTTLWEKAIEFIKLKPIIGYGIRENEIIITDYGRRYTSHNFMLQVLIMGGCTALIYFIFLMYKIHNKTKKYQNEIILNDLCIGLLVFYVCTLTEAAVFRYQWFAIFTLIYNIPNLLKENKVSISEEKR